MSIIWPLLDATSTVSQLTPPDWAGLAALLLGPYPLTVWLIWDNRRKDETIQQLTDASREAGNKTLDALLRTMK